jgi:hypothetical protein
LIFASFVFKYYDLVTLAKEARYSNIHHTLPYASFYRKPHDCVVCGARILITSIISRCLYAEFGPPDGSKERPLFTLPFDGDFCPVFGGSDKVQVIKGRPSLWSETKFPSGSNVECKLFFASFDTASSI